METGDYCYSSFHFRLSLEADAYPKIAPDAPYAARTLNVYLPQCYYRISWLLEEPKHFRNMMLGTGPGHWVEQRGRESGVSLDSPGETTDISSGHSSLTIGWVSNNASARILFRTDRTLEHYTATLVIERSRHTLLSKWTEARFLLWS